MTKIDMRERAAAARTLVWPALGLAVGGVFIAVAIHGQRPLSPAGVIGGIIVVAALASMWLEWRASRGWAITNQDGQLTLIDPRGVRVRLATNEVRVAKRVVREVDELAMPQLWRAIGVRGSDAEGRRQALRPVAKSHLQTHLQLQPEPGSQWGKKAELSDMIGAHGVEIPMDASVSDRKLAAFFTDLGITYYGK